MVLDPAKTVAMLIKKGLLDVSSLTENKITVTSSSRRNYNLRIFCENNTSYFVKQSADGFNRTAIENEAAAYQLLKSEMLPMVSEYLPTFYEYEPDRGVLILGLLISGEDLRTYHIEKRKFSKLISAQLGKALATLHLNTTQLVNDPLAYKLGSHLPSTLFLIEPSVKMMHSVSQGQIELITFLQGSKDMRDCLMRVRHNWETDSLIHSDMKWDNIIALGRSDRLTRRTRVKLVDWETARFGDSAWDVGAIFGNYLALWRASSSLTNVNSQRASIKRSLYSIDDMQPAMGAFWKAYISSRKLTSSQSIDFLHRSVNYAGVWLVQIAFEFVTYSMTLTREAIVLLELSEQILLRPQETLIHLLGSGSWDE